jgi:hypothetical protein
MANVIFGTMSGKNDPLYGKFEHPIKAMIQDEADSWEGKKNILDFLFNVEKSYGFSETIMARNGFDTFQSKGEGQSAENDVTEMAYQKTIKHIEFGKEFTVTRKMAADSKKALCPEVKSAVKAFTDAYRKTRVQFGEYLLTNGDKASFVYNKATVDLTTGDGLPLFSGNHTFASEKMKGKTQSNYFYGANQLDTAENFEMFLTLASNKLRNFKNEKGEVMGYTADIVIIPGNRPRLEAIAKKVIGSERTCGSNDNDINIQFGNWNLVVMMDWVANDDRCIVMSSSANRSLLAGMFFDREGLDVQNEVDIHTRNYIWNGYCRFGGGFTTWKHALMMVGSETKPAGSTATDINA